MSVFTPSFECRRTSAWQRAGTALLGCVMLMACARPAAPETALPPAANSKATTFDISSITLARDCMGCPTGTQLELRRDGTVVATRTGKARLGTADAVSRAALPAAEFDALARQLVASGYFEMAAVYEEAGVQDGSWATWNVVRRGVVHQVFTREDAGPAALKAIEAALDALQARLAFVPDAR